MLLATDWPQQYARLADWEAMPRESVAARQTEADLLQFASTLETEARRLKDRTEEFRARLLRARVQWVRGERPAPLGAPRARIDYLPGEALLMAELLADGPERARAAASALRTPQTQDRLAPLLPGIVRVERLGLRWDSALALTDPNSRDELLRERLRTLAQSNRLAQALEEARTRLDPLTDHALLVDLHLAAGESARARRVLGQALAAGASGAELRLARLELEQNRPWVAVELLHSVLAKEPGNGEAWLGLSAALLPPVRPRGPASANNSAQPPVLESSPSTRP